MGEFSGPPEPERRLRLSRLAVVTDIGERHIVTDLVGLQRLVLSAELGRLCELLRIRPMTPAEFAAECPSGVDAARILKLLRSRGIAVEEDADEWAGMRRLTEEPAYRYWQPRELGVGDFAVASGGSLHDLRFLLLGGCVLQFAQDSLVKSGLRAGFDITVRHRWPDDWSGLAELIEEWDPQVTVWQTSVQPLMSGLWDDGPFRGAAERDRRARALERFLTRRVERLAGMLGPRLGLVHNFAPPAVSPFGPADRGAEDGFTHLVERLNRTLRDSVARHDGLRVVDEEEMAFRLGAENLFDDLVFPYAHHGGRPDPSLDVPNQLPLLSDALATAYLDAYRSFHGLGRVKCIVVDLDGTLWPGIAAEDGFGWLDTDATSRWVHLGLHQVLRLAKERGIHLVTCSKGTAEVTLDAWRQVADSWPILRPDDFVMHRIAWTAKSDSLRTVIDRLGVAPDSVLFLDDNPVERAEVAARVPGVRVVDLPVHRFREYLLKEPGCWMTGGTEEARRRFLTTKAMLARDELAEVMDHEEFLRDMRIRATVRAADADDVPRVVELLERTTQCTTTGRRYSPGRVRELLEDPCSDVAVLSVADRFADYGLVGVFIAEGDLVTALAVSCRVLGLSVVVPFLATALRGTGRARAGVRGLLLRTARNEPAWRVFGDAGFRDAGEEGFVLDDAAALPDVAEMPGEIVYR